jgi:hypothetical protein
MKSKTYFPGGTELGDILASFGHARLVKHLNGTYELRGGSKQDRLAAKEWLAVFWRDVEVREAFPAHRASPQLPVPLAAD